MYTDECFQPYHDSLFFYQKHYIMMFLLPLETHFDVLEIMEHWAIL